MRPIKITDVRVVPGDTYLPSFLVGYRLTLDSFRKAGALGAEEILLPHYGVVGKKEMQVYLERSEEATVKTAERIVKLLRAGWSQEKILRLCENEDYRENVSPIYPIDAFRLNTSIMIGQAEKELLQKNAEAERISLRSFIFR